jgi:HAE1 family hydrophobic/amphiphilic exporter-1
VLDGPAQTLTIQGGAQLMKAADFAKLIVATRDGLPVRLKDVATVEDSYQSVKAAGSLQRRALDRAAGAAPAERQHRAGGRRRARAAAALPAQLPASIKINLVNDRSISIREAIHDVNLTLAG